jgi:ribose transport system permease protein
VTAPPLAAATPGPASARAARFLREPYLLSLCLFVAFCGINLALQRDFFTPPILIANLTTFLPLIIIAVGQTYVVLGGSIDLSLGSIVSLVNVVVVVLIEKLGGGTDAIFAGIAVGLLVGGACGAVNGAVIGLFRLPPIIATFASSIVIGGLALIVLPQAGGSLPEAYYTVYGDAVLGVPTPLLVLIAVILVAAAVGRTRFRVHLAAVGGNLQGAYQTGLSVTRIRIASHALGGLAASAAALCILGVAGAGDPLMGQAFTLGSVSAVVLGGTALAGGWGGIVGSMLGGAILGLINNIIFFADIAYVYQSIVQGVIILLALAAGVFVARRTQ